MHGYTPLPNEQLTALANTTVSGYARRPAGEFMTVEDAGARPLAGRLALGFRAAAAGGPWPLRIAARLAKAVVTLVGVASWSSSCCGCCRATRSPPASASTPGLLTKAQYADLAHFYGIGKPLPQQFGQWAGPCCTGTWAYPSRAAGPSPR